MENFIKGIHHITAIAGEPQRNYDFYTKTLGLRMVKKTVNFDDPQTYHFYYGDTNGTPGTILTFFPWPRVKHGKNGAGMATEIGFSIPPSGIGFWKHRFQDLNIPHEEMQEQFGEKYISFRDPDGLQLKLVGAEFSSENAWHTSEIPESAAIRAFHSVTLTLKNIAPTASVLTDILQYHLTGQEDNVYRYKPSEPAMASFVDLLYAPEAPQGNVAGGTNHHVAFRVSNEASLMLMRQRVLDHKLHITDKIDRQYFYSLYFREPGGVLFEIATDNPGFAIDESNETLGQNLKLPPQYEQYRSAIEKTLPVLIT